VVEGQAGRVPDPAPPVPRTISSWRREAADAVVLRLECGHDRHVRHRPPLSRHGWVMDDAGCEVRVGEPIECLRCGQRLLPEAVQVYRRTADFDQDTVPAGLLHAHSTKAGTWGRLVVEDGQLWLSFEPPLSVEVLAQPGSPAVIPPQLRHHVRLAGPVRFHVEFLRVSAGG
jgi:tellurite methyltransferase